MYNVHLVFVALYQYTGTT